MNKDGVRTPDTITAEKYSQLERLVPLNYLDPVNDLLSFTTESISFAHKKVFIHILSHKL